jgi:hypothetical protein
MRMRQISFASAEHQGKKRVTRREKFLVSRHASNVGYSLDSLMRASPVVNCQLIRALS